MTFESLQLTRQGGFDATAARAWLSSQPWAFVDPHGERIHVSGRHSDVASNLAFRQANPDRFPFGVVVEFGDTGMILEARADAVTLVRTKEFLSYALQDGAWTMRLDGGAQEVPADISVLFPHPDPPEHELADDPLGRPVQVGQLTSYMVGGQDDKWELKVHSSGALSLTQARDGSVVHSVRGGLEPEARLAWLKAVAHLDEDDDELEGKLDSAYVLCVMVETDDDDWSLYMDVRDPSPTASKLTALIEAWRPILDAWNGEGLPARFGCDLPGE
jgi:hypothetical protein